MLLKSNRWRVHGRTVLLPILAMALLIGAWEAAVDLFAIPGYLLPAPSKIAVETAAMRWVVLDHSLSTFTTIMLGFLASIVISFPLAVMIASSPLISSALYPILVMTQAVPKIAIAPILVIMLGSGELPRVAVTVLVAFFPLVLSISTGLLSVPPELIELGRSLKASRLQLLLQVRLPYAIPFIFSGLKLAITFSAVGAVVGEFVAADKGLGYQIFSSMGFFRTPLAFGALVILSVMSIVLFQAVVIVERIFFPWSAKEQVD
jgi:NitT/TauT family transport system permease protein